MLLARKLLMVLKTIRRFMGDLAQAGVTAARSLSPFSSIASGVFGTASSLLGGLFGYKSVKKQIQAQKEENQLNREWNLSLAEKQNQWNIDQWNRENEYNTPLAQMSRLKDAGLNPDLMYGQGISGLTSASSPTMTAGAPSSPVDLSSAYNRMPTVGQLVNEGMQTGLLAAQIQKTKEETRSQHIANYSLFQMNQAELDKLIADTDLSEEQRNVANANVQSLLTSVDRFSEETKYFRDRNNGLTYDQYMSRLNYELSSKKFQAEARELLTSSGLNVAQINAILKKLPYELGVMSMQTIAGAGGNSELSGLVNTVIGLGKTASTQDLIKKLGQSSSEDILKSLDAFFDLLGRTLNSPYLRDESYSNWKKRNSKD
nr:MAG TPA: DNA pilot protein VP2 [Microviridae sp.]